MRGVVLADTGPLYAMRDPDDERHGRAREELAKIGKENLTIAVPYPILLEAYTLVMRRLGLDEARGFLDELEEKYPFVVAGPADHQKAAETVNRYPDQEITLVDAVLDAISKRLEVPVWTHDHHFNVLGSMVWYPAT